MNLRVGGIGRLVAPQKGQCKRCRTPWGFVDGHVTKFTDTEGCFPLCERCWTELGTADARMPFYRVLWEQWAFDSAHHPRFGDVVPWEQIEAAVYREQDIERVTA